MPPPPNTTPASEEDPFGGMDPMAWLESLARRQGANPDELTTDANLDIPVLSADTQIDEPGYTPYETGSSKPAPEPPKPTPVATEPTAEDPFGGMDPMAWLESLARRQGANVDELTTAADLDVPVPPSGAVETGPGYTPGYDVGPSAKAAEPVQLAPSRPEPVQFSAPVQPARPAEPARPAPAAFNAFTPEPQRDIRPAIIPQAPETIRIEAPQPPPPQPLRSSAPPTPPIEPPQPVAPAAALESADAGGDDLFGGIDPMAWLESLAKRQGANVDELTTSADFDIPMPDADAVETGPGYTPGYDVAPPRPQSTPQSDATPAPQRALEPEPIPDWLAAAAPPAAIEIEDETPYPEPIFDAYFQPTTRPDPEPEPTPEAEAIADDPFGGMDPMSWLEALAKRQGAKEEELVTGGHAIIPPAPTSVIIDEPGYSDYTGFGGPPLSAELETPTILPPPVNVPRAPTTPPPLRALPPIQTPPIPEFDDADPIKWLESLSQVGAPPSQPEPTAQPTPSEALDLSFFTTDSSANILQADSALNWLEQIVGEDAPTTNVLEDAAAFFAPEGQPTAVDEAGGLSNDPNELLSWLTKQTENLATVHELEDPDAQPVSDPIATPTSDDLAPGELPDWLRDQLSAAPITPVASVWLDQVKEPPVPAEMPDWLAESLPPAGNDGTLDLEQLLTDAPLPIPAPVSSTAKLSSAEIAALTGPASDTIDPWAEALDAEFQRNRAGDVSIPDWYLEALERNGEALDDIPVEEPEPELIALPLAPASEIIQVSVEDWLSELEEATLGEPAAASSEPISEALASDELPAWLLAAAPEPVIETPEPVLEMPETPNDEDNLIDDWTARVNAGDELPDWLTPREAPDPFDRATRVIALEPGITPPAPPTRTDLPTQRPQQAPEPRIEQPAAYLPQIDLSGALAAARDLIARGSHLDSLRHLEPLVDAGQDLDSVIGELGKVVAAQPRAPRPRRLLGDAYMRTGRLQDALDTYRSALDQL